MAYKAPVMLPSLPMIELMLNPLHRALICAMM
jgi:hypothetical protein